MAQMARRDSFQVDLGGVVDLLSRHIYSGPRVYLRELLQNAVDACSALAELDVAADFTPSITILPITAERDTFTLSDNGIGLTAAEARELLATVGRTSKRDEFGLQRTGRLGQFGIGLLSCFMVADEIIMVSRSALPGARGVQWSGRADGTFALTELSDAATDALPIGTSVRLVPRPDERTLLSEEAVRTIAGEYGRYLPVSIQVEGIKHETVTETPVFSAGTSRVQRLQAGTERLHRTPFDVIDLTGPGIEGVAYVLPEPQAPHMSRRHSVYVNRMLVSHGPTPLLPQWAFFVECELNSSDLQPTASREALVDDSALATTREFIAAKIRSWLLDLGRTMPHRVREFTRIHDLALRELCLSDPELAGTVLGVLELETSRGRMPIADLATLAASENITLQIASSLDDFRQITAISRPDALIINGGYIHDADLARMIPAHYQGVSVSAVNVHDALDLMELPPLDVVKQARVLEQRATHALAEVSVRASLRVFEPVDIPAVVIIDREAEASRDRADARSSTTDQWADILETVDNNLSDLKKSNGTNMNAPGTAVLCLNWHNALIRQLAHISDDAVLTRTIRLLYVQALLSARRPLNSKERLMLTDSLSDLVALSVSADF